MFEDVIRQRHLNMLFSDSHEKHKLDDRRSPQEFTEGVDEEVVGQQCQLDQQHQRVVTGLEHLRGLVLQTTKLHSLFTSLLHSIF